MCAGPGAGHCHVISHVEGYPSEGLKFTRTRIQRYAHTQVPVYLTLVVLSFQTILSF